MAFGDYGINISDADFDEAFADEDKIRRAPAQFVRIGEVGRWFKAGVETMRGAARTIYRAYIQPLTGTRRSKFNVAMASEAPAARKLAYQKLSFAWDDLCVFQHTIKWNTMEAMKSEDPAYAVVELASELYTQAAEDIREQKSLAIFQASSCMMAKVLQIYDKDGTTFNDLSPAAGHTPAYISISGGNIAQFQKGMILDIFDASSTGGSDTKNATVVVLDVIKGEDGPFYAGSRVASIGPGLVVEPCAATGSTSTGTGYDAYWNAVGTPAAGDFIARSGEFSTATAGNNLFGLPDWFNPAVDVYDDEAGVVIPRDEDGHRWALPYIVTGGTSGSEETFDMDIHLAELANNWITMVRAGWDAREKLGQGMRTGANQTMEIDRHLVLAMEPNMARWITQTAATDTARFMSAAAMTPDAAAKMRRTAVVGFTDFIYHDPNLGYCTLQPDHGCTPKMVYVLNPETWKWSAPKGYNGEAVHWIMNGNSRVWPLPGDTLKTPTHECQATAEDMAYLYCDQMQANARIEYVKAG